MIFFFVQKMKISFFQKKTKKTKIPFLQMRNIFFCKNDIFCWKTGSSSSGSKTSQKCMANNSTFVMLK